ncbi:MAG: hypothetical protein R3Y36_05085, partial [Spirochaetales bacterium]
MKKYYIYICLLAIIFAMSCENPMYEDVITQTEYDAIIEREGIVTVYAPSAQAVYLQFTENGVEQVSASSKDWHIYSPDTTWRFGSNSGTTATAVGSGGTGGVKVFKGVNFYDITSINHTNGQITDLGSDFAVDETYDYNSGSMTNLNLNYYLTKSLYNTTTTTPSETYLFWFDMASMTSGTGYLAGTDYIFIIKDGNGGNYVKIQPVQITTDGSGMSFDNRVYLFIYE